MKRKLIQQAGQALTITVPVEWARKNGLKAGDEIELEESEKDIILKAGRKTLGGSVEIDTENFTERMHYSYLNAAYARGVDEIAMKCRIYPDLNQNIGMAVVSQKDNMVTVRDVSGVSSENLDEIFKRVFQMIMNFYYSAVEDIFGAEKATRSSIEKLDIEINKFSLFLQRSIMKRSYPDAELGRILFAYSFELEIIGDEILRLWRANVEECRKIKKNSQLKELIKMSKEGLQKSFEIYYQSSSQKIKELMILRDSVREKSAKLMKSMPEYSSFIIRAVKIIEDAKDLTHLSLMKKLVPEKK